MKNKSLIIAEWLLLIPVFMFVIQQTPEFIPFVLVLQIMLIAFYRWD